MTVEEFEKKVKMWGDLCGMNTDLSNGKGQDALDALKVMLSDEGIDELIINTNLGAVCHKYLHHDGFHEMVERIVSIIRSLQRMHNEELAALKEQYRWRKQSEEPVPKDILVEVYDPCSRMLDSVRLDDASDDDYVSQSEYWRPLDVSLEEAK